MVLTNFTSVLETSRFFPTTSVLCMCSLFYSSFSFKCFYCEPGDESSFFGAHFQSSVPFREYPRAVNHLELYDCSLKLEEQGNVQSWLP